MRVVSNKVKDILSPDCRRKKTEHTIIQKEKSDNGLYDYEYTVSSQTGRSKTLSPNCRRKKNPAHHK